MRADARRSRNELIAAARRVFAERGLDAPLDAVAREAGVGRATQHRHFPTRASLLLASFDDHVQWLAEVVADAAPEDAFVAVLLAGGEAAAHNRGLVEMLLRHPDGREARDNLVASMQQMLATPLRDAQRAGRVRDDLQIEDFPALIEMYAGAFVRTAGLSRAHRRRALALVAGAIAPTAPPLPALDDNPD